MTESEEAIYERGHRAAWVGLLHTALRELGYSDPETQKAAWIPEREATIAQLRKVCAEYGDNDWEPNLHLADVIEKHLWRHLEASQEGTGNG